jgi:hypothetical protein
MSDQTGIDGLRRGWGKDITVDDGDRGRTVGTLFRWSADGRSVLRRPCSFFRTHGAMMLSIAAAACGQACATRCAERQERGNERQAEDGQQRNGQKFSQQLY